MQTVQVSVSETPQPVYDDEQPVATDQDGLLDEYGVAEAATLCTVVVRTVYRIHARTLSREGFTRTPQDCPECADGQLWSLFNETVCDQCAIVFDEEDRRNGSRSDPDPWEALGGDRDAYRSGKKRCVGGYEYPYDWVSTSDLDRMTSVADLDATEFYR